MGKSDANSTVVLSVNINCCDACPQKVKKLLLKVKGVESVDVDREKRLVSVTGKADTNLLIKAVAKMKKKAEVVPSKPTKEKEEPKKEKEEPTKEKEEPKVDGVDPEVCRNPYYTNHGSHGMHYYPGMHEYNSWPMPPADYPPQCPWTNTQDEHGHPSYGANYPSGYDYYNNFF